MKDYVIMTDSSCDLPQSLANELNLTVVPLTVVLNGNSYFNYLDERDIKFNDFYKELRNGATASTSAVNVDQFLVAMKEQLDAGKDILYLGFSSGLSVTYNSAVIAKNELLEEYPDCKIVTVDTLSASMGQGLLVYLAAKEKEKGKSIEEVAKFAEENRNLIAHHFTVNDLNHLHRGGRISKTAAFIGTALNIKPILKVNPEGKLVSNGKARGRKQALKMLLESIKSLGARLDEVPIFIAQGDCMEEAKQFEMMIREQIDVKDILIHHVGPVIGAHTGPGIMATFFLASKRE